MGKSLASYVCVDKTVGVVGVYRCFKEISYRTVSSYQPEKKKKEEEKMFLFVL